MSCTFKILADFTCGQLGCDAIVTGSTTGLKVETTSDTDSYGHVSTHMMLVPTDIPEGWSTRTFFGTDFYYCKEHKPR